MIGNDIVDLSSAVVREGRWQSKRWQQKVFTELEREMIAHSNNDASVVWSLWSKKESVYKLHLQRFPSRKLAPANIECGYSDIKHGYVVLEQKKYWCETLVHIDKNMLFSLAKRTPNEYTKTRFFSVSRDKYDVQHKSSHTMLRAMAGQEYTIDERSINIIKDNSGAPRLYNNGKLMPVFCSITHDGYFGAVSIQTK